MSSFRSIGRIADAPNASQGFKRHCAMAKLAKRDAMTFEAFLARHGRNWPAQGEVAPVEDDQSSRIAALEAELASLRGASAPAASKPRRVNGWKVGRTFAYTAKNGNVTQHTVIEVTEDRVITDAVRANGENYSFTLSALTGYAKSQVS